MMKSFSAAELVRRSSEQPSKPIIEGLLNEGDILLIHGTEQSFQSVLVFQIAESLSQATPLLRLWSVSRRRKVGVIATTMKPPELGERLAKMFADREPPDNIQFLSHKPIDSSWHPLKAKQWITEQAIEVLIVDVANDFIEREKRNSLHYGSKGRFLDDDVVTKFFDDLRKLPVQARLAVLQDHQHNLEKVRAWKQQPDVILCLKRIKNTNEVRLEFEKFQHGNLDTLSLWFDRGCFRLTPLPPVVAVLEFGPRSLQDVMADLGVRFGMDKSKGGKMLKEQKSYLRESPKDVYEINWARAAKAPWHQFVVNPVGAQ